MKFRKLLTLLLITLPLSAFAQQPPGADLTAEIVSLKQAWALANYRSTDDDQKVKALEALVPRAQELETRFPGRPEPRIWEGILWSSHAGAKGGLGALGSAKKARALLEQALMQDERALDGSGLTTLGALYARVPGFPIGFGDKKKARALFEKAIAVNPDGIDPNYWYGDFLASQGQAAQARGYLQKALRAVPNPLQPVADQGRRGEITALLTKLGDAR